MRAAGHASRRAEFVPQQTSTNAQLIGNNIVDRQEVIDWPEILGGHFCNLEIQTCMMSEEIFRGQALGEQVCHIVRTCSMFNFEFSESHLGFHPRQSNLHMPAPLRDILPNQTLQCRGTVRFQWNLGHTPLVFMFIHCDWRFSGSALGQPSLHFIFVNSCKNRESISMLRFNRNFWVLGVVESSWPDIGNRNLSIPPKAFQNTLHRGSNYLVPGTFTQQVEERFDADCGSSLSTYLRILWVALDYFFGSQLDQPNFNKGMVSHIVDNLHGVLYLIERGWKIWELFHHDGSVCPGSQDSLIGHYWLELLATLSTNAWIIVWICNQCPLTTWNWFGGKVQVRNHEASNFLW